MSLNQQLIEAAENGNLKKVKDLLQQGADIHVFNKDGCPDAAVCVAAGNGHLNVAVRRAAKNGHLDVVRFLVKKGAAINMNQQLIKAASRGHLDIVRFLHKSGADIHAAGYDGPGRHAVRRAAKNGHLDVVRFLVKKGASIEIDRELIKAAIKGHLAVARFLALRPGLVRCARAPPSVRPTREGEERS